jgi:hypothetical protein
VIQRKEYAVTRRKVSVELTPDEVIDLRMLRFELVKFQPGPGNKCDRARDAVRYLRIVDKILRATED